MTTITIHEERTTTADRGAVWRLLGDSSTWPDWTPIDEHATERPGGADGTGEVRRFRNGRVKVREEIVERRPCERLTYVLLAGLPLRDYRAEIDLADVDGGGTRITWHTTFAPKVPGTGWVYRFALTRATQGFIDGLASAAAA